MAGQPAGGYRPSTEQGQAPVPAHPSPRIVVYEYELIPAVPSPRIAAKALRLLEQHRVTRRLDHSTLVIRGDTAFYTVVASEQGVRCSCIPGDNLDPVSCSHKVAAQIAWLEQRS